LSSDVIDCMPLGGREICNGLPEAVNLVDDLENRGRSVSWSRHWVINSSSLSSARLASTRRAVSREDSAVVQASSLSVYVTTYTKAVSSRVKGSDDELQRREVRTSSARPTSAAKERAV
jgi:hypothetical protein